VAFKWQAVTYVFCTREGIKDKALLGGVTYGFQRKWDSIKNEHGPALPLAPKKERS